MRLQPADANKTGYRKNFYAKRKLFNHFVHYEKELTDQIIHQKFQL